jgi:hypothetical protein
MDTILSHTYSKGVWLMIGGRKDDKGSVRGEDWLEFP